jgi:hypothetical protein
VPFILDYSQGETGKEDSIAIQSSKSPMEVALHETIHVVILRLDGLDVADVVDHEDAAWTRLVESQKFTVAALMAPEVYMRLNNIDFTDVSVSSDRDAVADCFRPESVEDIREANRELLDIIFQCPYVNAAITILAARMHDALREHKVMNGISIHEIIDPILKYSPHADGLRERLNQKVGRMPD